MRTSTHIKHYRGWLVMTILLLASLLLGACTAATPTEESTEPAGVDYSGLPFVGKTWYWLGTQFNDGSTTTVADPSRYSIVFNADGTYNGKADCNNVNGSYTVDGNQLTIGPGAMTMMACPEDSQDGVFLEQLNMVGGWLEQDGFLYLELQADSGAMQFGEQPTGAAATVDYSALPFIAKTWNWLGSQFSDGSTTVVADPSRYSIVFNADGTYNGKADCNNLVGSYTVEENRITINPGAMTLMACADSSQDAEFVRQLGLVGSWFEQDSFLYLEFQADSGSMQLGELPAAAEGVDTSGEPFIGEVWQWLRIDFSNDATLVSPNPATYTIEFLPDGSLTGMADCNTMGGSYTVDGASLTIDAFQMTRMACPPESLADEYTQRLSEVASYVLQDGVLYLNLKMDGGNMVFGKTPVAILPTPEAGQPSAVAINNVNVRSGPSTSYPIFGVMSRDRSAQVVGVSEDGRWWAVSVPVSAQGHGWVSAENVTVTGGESVPVLAAPPLPPSTQFVGPNPDDPQVTVTEAAYVRSGPGENYSSYGVALPGDIAGVIGRSQDGQWYVVRVNPANIPAGSAWIQSVYTASANTQNVAVIQAPPPPEQILPEPANPNAVTLDALNVRTGPSTQFPILGTIPARQPVELIGRSLDGAWYAMNIPPSVNASGIGWSAAQWLVTNATNLPIMSGPPLPPPVETPPPSTSGLVGVTTEPLNVRSGPSSSYPSYGTLPAGTTVTITGANQNLSWYQIIIPASVDASGLGWVSASFVQVQGSGQPPVVPTPTVAPPIVVPTPPPTTTPYVITLEPLNARTGPGSQYPSLGTIPANTTIPVNGVSPDGAWFMLNFSNSPTGQVWINAAFVQAFNTGNLPVVQPPPLP
jgi:heat shock protein HslJ/uncharacterized protein YraI